MNRIVWRKGGKKETRGKIRVIGLERFFFFFFLEGGRASGRLSGANGKVKEGIGCWTSGSINGFYRGESRVLRLIYGFLRISFFFFFFLGKKFSLRDLSS